jgi:hypothetical protein
MDSLITMDSVLGVIGAIIVTFVLLCVLSLVTWLLRLAFSKLGVKINDDDAS